jgi:hypothetical protein
MCKAKRFKEDTLAYRQHMEQFDDHVEALQRVDELEQEMPIEDEYADTAAAALTLQGDDDLLADIPFDMKLATYTHRFELHYCPLIPRLKYLISHPIFSHLFWYADSHMVNADPNVVDDTHQSPMYAKAKSFFAGTADLCVFFGLSADRASISKHKIKHGYAILPVLLSIVNWPIWIRTQEKYLLLSALPPKHIKDPTICFGNY